MSLDRHQTFCVKIFSKIPKISLIYSKYFSDPASGGTYDWVRDSVGVKWAYALELRPGPNAFNGFILPTSQIVPTAEETWAGLKSIAGEMMKKK